MEKLSLATSEKELMRRMEQICNWHIYTAGIVLHRSKLILVSLPVIMVIKQPMIFLKGQCLLFKY